MSTIFSKIIAKEIPATIVHEDEHCLAFKDINPQAPVHLLLIPKKEIPSIADVEDQDQPLLGHMMRVARKVAEEAGISESGYRLVANIRGDGGQEVGHLHFHILGGRRLSWPPG